MATIKQIEANRLNAQRSTGPKTDAGKAVSRLNNLKHGLRASTVVLSEESHEEFDAECQRLLDRYQPAGVDEEHLIEQLVVSWWQSARVGRLIAASFVQIRFEIATKSWAPPLPGETPLDTLMRQYADRDGARKAFNTFSQMEDRYNRAYARAEARLCKLQKERAKQPQPEPEPQPQPEAPLAPSCPFSPEAPLAPLAPLAPSCPSYPDN